MDITVEVMLPPRGATDYAQSGNVTWPLLGIVAVYPRRTFEVIALPVTGYLHVNGVPEHPSWTLRGLTQAQLFQGLNMVLTDAVTDAEGNLITRRNWTGQPTGIPNNLRSALLANRQVTLTWNQFRNLMRNFGEARALTGEDFDFTSTVFTV
jgi:hypothetical protein